MIPLSNSLNTELSFPFKKEDSIERLAQRRHMHTHGHNTLQERTLSEITVTQQDEVQVCRKIHKRQTVHTLPSCMLIICSLKIPAVVLCEIFSLKEKKNKNLCVEISYSRSMKLK